MDTPPAKFSPAGNNHPACKDSAPSSDPSVVPKVLAGWCGHCLLLRPPPAVRDSTGSKVVRRENGGTVHQNSAVREEGVSTLASNVETVSLFFHCAAIK